MSFISFNRENKQFEEDLKSYLSTLEEGLPLKISIRIPTDRNDSKTLIRRVRAILRFDQVIIRNPDSVVEFFEKNKTKSIEVVMMAAYSPQNCAYSIKYFKQYFLYLVELALNS